MANLLSTVIFGVRNADKTINDNPARFPVFLGQGTKVVRKVVEYDKELSDALKSIKTTSPILRGLSATVDFAAKNVNPLICVAGGVKVLTADDKQKEFVNQSAALGTMFCAEKSYKALVDAKHVAKIADKLGQTDNLLKLLNSQKLKNFKAKVGDKKLKVIMYILDGLAFVGASMSGYTIGEVVAQKINKETKDLNNTKHVMNAYQTKCTTRQLA